MQITIDLDNIDNKDINQAIINKIKSLEKNDFIKMLYDKNFRSIISEAVTNVIKDTALSLSHEPKDTWNTTIDGPLAKRRIINELEQEKLKQEKNYIKNIIEEVIEKKIGKDNFIDMVVQEFPNLLVPALMNYSSKHMSEISEATIKNCIHRMYGCMNKNK